MNDIARNTLPYGTKDLRSKLVRSGKSGAIRCPVNDCMHWLKPPTRLQAGTPCPEHGIYVHGSATYTYTDYRRNLIVDAPYFEEHIRGNAFKYETHRFGSERSEDALTWNTFRSLQVAGCLNHVAELCTGIRRPAEPKLLLWGLEIKDTGVQPWDLLIRARERFESDLPVGRPKTEPDIALYLPGSYLLLIEAKFTSPNGVYLRDRKKNPLDFTIDQFINIYSSKELRILDHEEARRRDTIRYQLWRNMLFAEWMAAACSPQTKAYHANLVREGCEADVCGELLTVIHPEYRGRFEQFTWEQIYGIAVKQRLGLLCRYLETKTAGLKPAFRIASTVATGPKRRAGA